MVEMAREDKDTLITRLRNREDMLARIQAAKDAAALSAQDTEMKEPEFEHQSPKTQNFNVQFLGPPVLTLGREIAALSSDVAAGLEDMDSSETTPNTEGLDMAGGAETTSSQPHSA